jgi:hypothetical protein
VDYTFAGQIDTSVTVSDGDGDATKPIIIFLHGLGGSINDMSNPVANWPYNYDHVSPLGTDRDEGWSDYPGVGVWSFNLDNQPPVTSWAQALGAAGFRTVSYSQVENGGLLADPVAEFHAVFNALVQAFPKDMFVLLCHSRGGLLARQFLKESHRKELPLPITFLITLHSPHEGTNLANDANAVNSAIMTLTNIFGSIVNSALGWLTQIVNTPAYQELAVGSTFLTNLAAGETAIPGIQYFSFGGTSVELTRILSWVYTLGSAIPQWHWPPFHHVITEIEVPGISPVANSVPPISPELTEGKGDLLTANANCRIPLRGVVHQSNALNHAEALWDPNLQTQVLQILNVDMVNGGPGNGGGFWN